MKSCFRLVALMFVCASSSLLAQSIFLQQLDDSRATAEFERASFNLGSPSVSQPAGTKFVEIEFDHITDVDECYIGDNAFGGNRFSTDGLAEFADSTYTNAVAFYNNTGG